MLERIMDLLNELTENKNILHKNSNLKANGLLDEYSFGEMHCIEAISLIENPNVTKLALHLHLTKGAVTKIIKKLSLKSAINSYTNPQNRKEIYYQLTPIGEEINKKHEALHKDLCLADIEFLSAYDSKKLVVVEEFLENFNKYLQDKIRSTK